MHLTPKDQIVLLAGLEADGNRRARIWSRAELHASLAKLADAGYLGADGLADPSGIAAARSLRHITLDDLIDEHLEGEVTGEGSS